MPVAPGDRVGPYEVLEPLGEGSTAQVYRARDTKLGRDVALKVLPEQFAQSESRRLRFQHEAKVLATLNHPNVATIFGLDDDGAHIALAMELVPGTALAARIRPDGLPFNEALKLAVQIAAGLEAAHRVGVVHRDLKPANVLVTSSGVVKLVDFGIAKVIDMLTSAGDGAVTHVPAEPRTEQGEILGTVAYMSPEQARGEPIDGRSDIFSFGAVFYEMLTGRRPFDASDKVSTLAAILQSEPESPGSLIGTALPREYERIVLRCLRKDRERRFQTATDLKLALEDLATDAAKAVGYGISSRSGRRRRRRQRRRLALAGAVVAVAALALLVWLRGPASAPTPALRQLTSEAGLAITPAISPDGRLLAYASDRSDEGQLDIWVKQIAGGDPVRLTSGPDSKVNPQFSPDGKRVYYLGGASAIFEVPALGGQSRMIVDAAGPFSVSSGDDIVFHRPGTGTSPGPVFVRRAGAPGIEPWHPECVSAGAPVWSPDATRIAFAGVCRRIDAGSQRVGEILVAPVNDGVVQRIGTMDLQSAAPRIAWVRLAGGQETLLIPQRTGDSVNLYRVSLDGASQIVTRGTGLETWPAIAPNGELIFTRTEQTPSVWSLDISGNSRVPTKEASPARMFAASRDATTLIFGRMLGTDQGQLILRDRASGTETVLASHRVRLEDSGSLWPQISPDARRVIYRTALETTDRYIVSTEGGTTRRLAAASDFNVVSDWAPDGRRVIGECLRVARGICELVLDQGAARPILSDPKGGELLYPSFSWDGGWMTFMLRRGQRTQVMVTPVNANGTPAGSDRWVVVSPDGANGNRSRFSPEGDAIYYHLTRGSVVSLVRQALDPTTKRAIGNPSPLAPIQNIPQSVFNVGLQNVIAVTRTRIFYNNAETHSNVWATRLE